MMAQDYENRFSETKKPKATWYVILSEMFWIFCGMIFVVVILKILFK